MTAPRTAVSSRSVFPIPFSGRGRGVNHEMICLLFPTTYLTPSIFTSHFSSSSAHSSLASSRCRKSSLKRRGITNEEARQNDTLFPDIFNFDDVILPDIFSASCCVLTSLTFPSIIQRNGLLPQCLCLTQCRPRSGAPANWLLEAIYHEGRCC